MPAGPPRDAPPAPPETPTWPAGLARALEAGRRAFPGLAFDAVAFGRDVTLRVDARLCALGMEVSEEARSRWLERAAQGDLALAAACAARVPGAWDALVAEHAPRLEGFARARGADAAEAERLTADVLGDLLLPASGEDPRPLLATYAGGGSLFGFLAVLLARRQARRARDPRERRRARLETGADPDAGSEPRAAGTPTPAALAEADDDARCLDRALAAAVEELTAGEALALALKHRDGHSQRTIAGLLGVGEPRVSRIVASGVARLAAALARHCPGLADASAPRLREVLARHLAILGPVAAPVRDPTSLREDA